MDIKSIIKSIMKEQLVCLGKIFAKYKVEDELIWEVVKSFDLIYEKQKQQFENDVKNGKNTNGISKKDPHPALLHMLEKLDQ